MTLSHDHLRRCSVAADLGAARTRIYLKNSGLVVDEPSIVAVNTKTGALIAVGTPAERMAGRTPATIRVVKPIIGGTVVDIDMAQRMLRAMVGTKLRRAWRRNPLLRAAVCIPHDADPLARRAALETLVGVGARRVELVDSLITAGIGCGLPVEEPEATMIVQVGAATTEIAVLSLGSIVAADKVPMGGETVDRALLQHLRNEHELMLPSLAVRPLHEALGDPAQGLAEVAGRDVATGLARTVRVDPRSLRAAVMPPLTALLDTIRAVLHRCPPDLVADLAERGVMLTGGAAGLPGLDAIIRDNTGMPVQVADEPGLCAVQGLGALLEGRVRPRLVPLPEPTQGSRRRGRHSGRVPAASRTSGAAAAEAGADEQADREQHEASATV
ncbi:rod shape-determining protein [Streptomyces sp. NPDC049879]|uniref:rod shape-determining protein n=1 Tax=Streptomyces sp. NPDC049879 TaxID=3365598 RepID=UPI0037B75B50